MNGDIYTQYTIVIAPDEDEFHAFCPALKGCHTCGNTQAEALGHIQDAIVGYVASFEKHGDPVPGNVWLEAFDEWFKDHQIDFCAGQYYEMAQMAWLAGTVWARKEKRKNERMLWANNE